MAFLKTALANSAYSIAAPMSLPSVSDTFSQWLRPPSTRVHASSSECSSTHRTYSASCQPCSLWGSGIGDRTKIWCSTTNRGRQAVWLLDASSLFSRKNNGLSPLHQFFDINILPNSWTHRIARSTRYSSPINSRCPPRLPCVLSAMKALRANSRLVISLAICNFPLSPNGLAIEICRINVLITYFTIDVTLRSVRIFH